MKYQWLDLLRGVSALLVCANHLRAAMFVDYSALHDSSLFAKLFYFLTGLGSQSVIIFFVLSGFFVGGSVIKRWQQFNYTDYMLARLSRLWIVLVPALLLTLLIDLCIALAAPDLLDGADFGTINSGPQGQYSGTFLTFLQNMLFLQTISAPVFGSNGPLWSLCNEFWYYVCFPLFFFLFDRKAGLRTRVFAAAAIALLGATVLQGRMTGFLVWMLGAALVCLPREHMSMRPRHLLALAFLLMAAALALSKTAYLPAFLNMAVLGLASSLLILALRALPDMSPTFAALTDWLARSSYTLYLVHFPLVIWAYAGWFRGQQAVPGVLNYLIFAVLLAGLVLIAQVCWMLFEKHTDSVKRRLFAVLQRPQSRPLRS